MSSRSMRAWPDGANEDWSSVYEVAPLTGYAESSLSASIDPISFSIPAEGATSSPAADLPVGRLGADLPIGRPGEGTEAWPLPATAWTSPCRCCTCAAEALVYGAEDFVTTGGKWGASAVLGTPGGIVTWSIVGTGLTNQTGQAFFTGSTVDTLSLRADFRNQIAYAFNAWSQVANIQFQEVSDGGGNFGVGTAGHIRIGAGFIDGAVGSNVLARAFFPGAGTAGANATHGDVIFDSGNTWSTQLLFLTAVHEIGHSLGLNHENTNLAIMNPIINLALAGLQTDDINGIRAIYGNQPGTGDGAGNSTTSAVTLNVGSWQGAYSLNFTGDHDWFRTNLVAGQTYLFEHRGAGTSHGTLSDPRMSLYNSSGDWIVENDDAGTGFNSAILRTAAYTGAHYVDAYSFLNNATGSFTVSAQRLIYGGADFDNNGLDDVVWQDYSNGLTGAYFNGIGGFPQFWAALGTVSSDYHVHGFGDFNGDGRSDVLWRSTENNSTGYYASNGAGGFTWSGFGAVAANYSLVGTSDFNNDGLADVLWRNFQTGDTGFYRNSALGFTWAGLGVIGADFQVVGLGDYSGDGLDDVLWHNSANGGLGYYQMNQTGGASWVGIGITSNSIIGTGDFDGNGSSDVLYRNTSTGEVGYYQLIAGLHGGTVSFGVTPSNFQVVGTGDYNGNGVDDIMWRDLSTGVTGYYSNSFGGGVSWVYYSTTASNWDLL